MEGKEQVELFVRTAQVRTEKFLDFFQAVQKRTAMDEKRGSSFCRALLILQTAVSCRPDPDISAEGAVHGRSCRPAGFW